MSVILKNTADLYSEIFKLTSLREFHIYKKLISPSLFGEKENFFQNKRILELGTGGIGHAIAGFLSYGAKEIVGIDISSDNISTLKKRFYGNKKVKLLQCDICNLPDNLGKFDIIYADGVIHHTVCPELVISKTSSMLKQNGVFIVGLYGKGGLITLGMKFLRTIKKIIPRKLFFNITSSHCPYIAFFLGDYIYVPILKCYSENEAKALFKQKGFTKIERIPNRVVEKGWNRLLRASQSDYESILSRILHGYGWITLKAVK